MKYSLAQNGRRDLSADEWITPGNVSETEPSQPCLFPVPPVAVAPVTSHVIHK